jgi:hypothetical protein
MEALVVTSHLKKIIKKQEKRCPTQPFAITTFRKSVDGKGK